jgi:hypothetical protein
MGSGSHCWKPPAQINAAAFDLDEDHFLCQDLRQAPARMSSLRSHHHSEGGDAIICTFQIRKLRLREGLGLTQGHAARRQQSRPEP